MSIEKAITSGSVLVLHNVNESVDSIFLPLIYRINTNLTDDVGDGKYKSRYLFYSCNLPSFPEIDFFFSLLNILQIQVKTNRRHSLQIFLVYTKSTIFYLHYTDLSSKHTLRFSLSLSSCMMKPLKKRTHYSIFERIISNKCTAQKY